MPQDGLSAVPRLISNRWKNSGGLRQTAGQKKEERR